MSGESHGTDPGCFLTVGFISIPLAALGQLALKHWVVVTYPHNMPIPPNVVHNVELINHLLTAFLIFGTCLFFPIGVYIIIKNNMGHQGMKFERFFGVKRPETCPRCNGQLTWREGRIYSLFSIISAVWAIVFMGARNGRNHGDPIIPLENSPQWLIVSLLLVFAVSLGVVFYFHLFAEKFTFICQKCGEKISVDALPWSPTVKAFALVIALGMILFGALLLSLFFVVQTNTRIMRLLLLSMAILLATYGAIEWYRHAYIDKILINTNITLGYIQFGILVAITIHLVALVVAILAARRTP